MTRTTTAYAVVAVPIALLSTATLTYAENYTEHLVIINEFNFSIESLSVQVGDTIKWINKDIVPHTATAKDGTWNTGLIEPGGESIVSVSPGMMPNYYCEYHPMMIASIAIE